MAPPTAPKVTFDWSERDGDTIARCKLCGAHLISVTGRSELLQMTALHKTRCPGTSGAAATTPVEEFS